jgi:hypothetical protein
MNAHYKKYEHLAQKIGISELKKLIPFTPEQIRNALKSGDEYLNTLPLSKWDKAAGLLYPYGQYKISFLSPWDKIKYDRLSLAERVCILKYVAKHHLEI